MLHKRISFTAKTKCPNEHLWFCWNDYLPLFKMFFHLCQIRIYLHKWQPKMMGHQFYAKSDRWMTVRWGILHVNISLRIMQNIKIGAKKGGNTKFRNNCQIPLWIPWIKTTLSHIVSEINSSFAFGHQNVREMIFVKITRCLCRKIDQNQSISHPFWDIKDLFSSLGKTVAFS